MTVLYPAIEPYDHGLLDVGDGNLVYWEVCGNQHTRWSHINLNTFGDLFTQERLGRLALEDSRVAEVTLICQRRANCCWSKS